MHCQLTKRLKMPFFGLKSKRNSCFSAFLCFIFVALLKEKLYNVASFGMKEFS